MRPSLRLLPITFLLCIMGCGTLFNLGDPPHAPPNLFHAPCTCTPFGGAYRSGLLVLVGAHGWANSFVDGNLLDGPAYLALGLLAVPDVPLSLAGDVVTLPLAYARSKGEPWATWWGEKDVILHDPPTETQPASDALPRLPEQASSGKP